MMKSKWAGVVAGVLIVVALGMMFARLKRPGDEFVLDVPEYVGVQLAEQAAPLLGDEGDVLLIAPDLPGVEDPYVVAHRQGFLQALGRLTPGAKVIDAGVTADPMALQAGKPVFGAQELNRLVKQYQHCKVFVSVAGMPEVTRSQAANWSAAHPKLVVFAPLGGPANQLIEAGVLHAAIVPRDASLPDIEGNSLQARFDDDYTILTAQ